MGLGVTEVLDDVEQVVPPARVETGDMVAQLVEDLVHLAALIVSISTVARTGICAGTLKVCWAKVKTSSQSRASEMPPSLGR